MARSWSERLVKPVSPGVLKLVWRWSQDMRSKLHCDRHTARCERRVLSPSTTPGGVEEPRRFGFAFGSVACADFSDFVSGLFSRVRRGGEVSAVDFNLILDAFHSRWKASLLRLAA